MKRFDKGYIYSSLLLDLLSSFVIFFALFGEFFSDENVNEINIISALPYFVAVLIAIYLCFVAYRIMYYRTSGYELTETQIKCKMGVLFRKRSELDYGKIHAINKKQNLFQRIFGIAVLTVDSGSANTSHQAEITIIEKEKTVDALLNELNALKKNGLSADENSTKKEEILLSDSNSLYSFTSKRKMLYTLIKIASTAFFTALFCVLAIIVLGVCKLMLERNFLGSWGQYLLYAVLITFGALLIISVCSFIGYMLQSFVGYYNFSITKRDDNIQISFGLLEKHTNVFSFDRIKAVKISQGLVQRMLGFAAIKLEVIGYTRDAGSDSIETGVLVPFCKYDEINQILGKVLPGYIPDEKKTKAVSLFPFMSWFLLIFGIITGITLLGTVSVMTALSVPLSVTSAVALSILGASILVIALKLASSVLAYKTNGLSVNNGKITVYSGGFIKNITVFMAKNLIAVENVTTPLRKKKGIASLVMHLKTNAQSNEVKVHIQREMLSEEMEKLLKL